MCLSPLRIRNPNISKLVKNNPLLRISSDCESQYINVPCNICPVCVALRQNYFVQRVQMEALDNAIFFVTLTYSNNYIPKMVVKGEEYLIHDIRDLQNLWKRIRKNYPDLRFRYVVTQEFGSRTHRPHYHLLLFFPFSNFNLVNGKPTITELKSFERYLSDILLDEWCINVGSTRFPDYKPLCNFKQNGNFRNFDCQFVDTIYNDVSNVSFYVSKYVCKYDKYVDTILKKFRYYCNDEEYEIFKKWFKPKMFYSKGFGNVLSKKVIDKVYSDISFSLDQKSPYPLYFDELSGKSFPLSPYYRKRFVDVDTALEFLKNSTDSLSDYSRVLDFEEDVDAYFKKAFKYYDNMNYLNNNHNDIDYLID